MKTGGLAIGRLNMMQKQKIAAAKQEASKTAAEKLDAEEEELLEQMGQVAADRGEYFDEEGEREQLKALKADELKKRMKKMKTGGLAIGRLNMMQRQKIAAAEQEA